MKESRVPWWFRKKEEETMPPVKADYTVISSVNEKILMQLRRNLVPQIISSRDEIGLCTPQEHGDLMLGVYLYDIRENDEIRMNGMQTYDEQFQQFPPLYLNLHYMLTAYSNIDIRYREEENHRIIAKVMQIFHDYPMLSGEEDLRIERESLPFEQKMSIWHNVNAGYQLSLFYRVVPVRLDSTIRKEVTRVKEIQLRGDKG